MKDIFQLVEVNDSSWAETIRLYSGLLEDNERELFLLKLSNYNILLSAQCLSYCIDKNESVSSLICEKAKNNIYTDPTYAFAKPNILALVELQSLDHLIDMFKFFNNKTFVDFKLFIYLICSKSSNSFLANLLIKIHHFISDHLLWHFLMESSLISEQANKKFFLQIRSYSYWINLVKNVFDEIPHLLAFNKMLCIVEILNLNAQFSDRVIIDNLLDRSKLNNYRIRCFFEFLNKSKSKYYVFSYASQLLPNLKLWLEKFDFKVDCLGNEEILHYFLYSNFMINQAYSRNKFYDIIRLAKGRGSFKKSARSRKRAVLQNKINQILLKQDCITLVKDGTIILKKTFSFETAKLLLNYEDEIVDMDNVKYTYEPNKSKKRNKVQLDFQIGDLIVCRIERIYNSFAISSIEGGAMGRIYIGDIANKYVLNIYQELEIGKRVVAVIKNKKKNMYELSMKDVYKS